MGRIRGLLLTTFRQKDSETLSPFPIEQHLRSLAIVHQPSAHASQKVARNEIIPSPKKGRYNSGPSTSFNAAVPNATLTKHKLKVGCLQFCSAPY